MGSISHLKITGKRSFEQANTEYTNMKMCSISLMTKDIHIRELPLFVYHICVDIIIYVYVRVYIHF